MTLIVNGFVLSSPGAVGGEFCSSLLLSHLILPHLHIHRYSEYKEKKTFSAAQGLARQAELLFRQAQSLSPVVTPVGEFVDVIPFEGLVRYPASCR